VIRVGIYGGSGYTGQELIRLLLGHPGVTLAAATSRRFAGKAVSDIYPHFLGLTDLVYSDDTPEAMAAKADVIFLALPHGVCMDLAPHFVRTGRIVIDLSADFRIRDAAAYEAWYGPHRAAETLREAVYGLPEIHREALRKARFVANPGCYPTSIILGLAPLLRAGWLDPASIIADSASGVSGAGREPQTASLFCEVDGGFKAYKVAQHRHTPEIEQELSLLAGCGLKISFTPHLLPVKRGILSTIYGTLQREATPEEAIALCRAFYRDEPFVRICRKGQFPNLSSVVGSNFCDIGLTVDARTGRVIIVSAIDNLIKGASGQAIQNMNLLLGIDERTGLPGVALFP
jgi:N-acetyl-gamma-glutamyl-phosphate reductase